MAKDDGGAAFPTQHVSNGNTIVGMSLRDWFAGQALMGALASYIDGVPNLETAGAGADLTIKQAIARRCYLLADAMLAERNK
jgi:hypothetical protein